MSRSRLRSEFVGAQDDFIRDTTTKFLHLSAGYGFGKTRTLCYKLLQLSKLNHNMNGGVVVPSYTDFTRDVKIAMEDIFHDNNIKATYHNGDHSYRFPWTRGKLFVASAENKIRGPNWAYAGLNEVTLISIDRYREVIGRVRIKGAPCPQIVSSGTPEGLASDYYTAFVEKPLKNSRILYGDTRDNSHNLEEGYIDSIISSYPKQLIDAYLKGLWVNLSGNRFYYSYDPKINEWTEAKPDPDMPFLVSMDFNVDPFCMAVWQRYGNQLMGVDEIELKGGEGFNTENAIRALKAKGYTPQNSIIYPDPASKQRRTNGKPDAKILTDHGYTVRMKPTAPTFRERQLNMNKLFEQRRIIVNPITQPAMKKDLLAVEMDPVTLEKVKKNKNLTHFSDGLDYLIDVEMPFVSHRSGVSTPTIR